MIIFPKEEIYSKIRGKKIVFLLGSLELGGAERQVLILARYLKNDLSADVKIVGMNSPGKTALLCEEYGIPWSIIQNPWSENPLKRYLGFIRFIFRMRQLKPDIILPYTTYPNIICGLLWQYTGAELCIWNQRDEGLERFPKNIEQHAVRNIPLFISNSRHGKVFLIQTLGVDPEKIHVIPNGIEIGQPRIYQDSQNNKPEGDTKEIRVCMVANLSKYKDHETLIKAWSILTKKTRGQKIMLLLAGRFDRNHESIQKQMNDFELESSVQLLGNVDDIDGLYQTVDIAVLSSRQEGCPNAILEAMARGLPVIATDIPGNREALGMENSSFLAPPGNEDVLADRIFQMISNEPLRKRVGKMNYERIQKKFSVHQMVEKTSEIICRGLSG